MREVWTYEYVLTNWVPASTTQAHHQHGSKLMMNGLGVDDCLHTKHYYYCLPVGSTVPVVAVVLVSYKQAVYFIQLEY